jgi:hypothetical protein
MDPDERVADLLFSGETIVETAEFGSSVVVVTSHRVLALTPDVDGPNYRHVDRPNVSGVRIETIGATRWLRRAARPFVVGVVLLIGGWSVDLGGFTSALDGTSTEAAGTAGIGGITSMARDLGRVLALFDEALLVGGVACLFLVVGLLALYLSSRQRSLTISVAGGADVEVPCEGASEESVDRLRAVLRGGSTGTS